MRGYFKIKVGFIIFSLIAIMLMGCGKNPVDSTLDNMSENVVSEESSNDTEIKKKEVKNRSDEVASKKKEIQNFLDKAESSSKEYINNAAYWEEKANATEVEIVMDFLKWNNYGSFDSLTGDIVVKVFLIDDTKSQWNEQDVNRLKSSFESGTERLMKEANAYGNNLNMKLEYISSKIDIDFQDNDEDGEKLFQALNLFETEVIVTDKKNPIVFAVNQNGRSAKTWGDREYIILYSKYDVENTYIHELLHWYGAADLYYNDDMSELADKYLPQSIMNRLDEYKNPVVDELTAYLIGWRKELSVDAEKFITEVNMFDAEEVIDSGIEDSKSGYVENYEVSALLGGLYTGELKRGQLHGYGKMVWDDGTHHQEYEGYWENGLMEGQGTMIYSDGTVEKGIWKEGELIEPN